MLEEMVCDQEVLRAIGDGGQRFAVIDDVGGLQRKAVKLGIMAEQVLQAEAVYIANRRRAGDRKGALQRSDLDARTIKEFSSQPVPRSFLIVFQNKSGGEFGSGLISSFRVCLHNLDGIRSSPACAQRSHGAEP